MTTPAVVVESLTKSFGATDGGRRAFVRGRAGRDLRAARAQRRRQDDHAAHPRGHPAADARARPRGGAGRRAGTARRAATPRLPHRHDGTVSAPHRTRAARLLRPPARPGPGRRRGACRRAGGRAASDALLRPALRGALDGRAAAGVDRARRAARPRRAHPRRADGRPGRAGDRASCATSSGRSAIAARRWCSRPTTSPRRSCSAIGSACCTAGACWQRARRRAARAAGDAPSLEEAFLRLVGASPTPAQAARAPPT